MGSSRLLFRWGDWRNRCRWHSLCRHRGHSLGAGWWHGHKRLRRGLRRGRGQGWGGWRSCLKNMLNVMDLQGRRRGAELWKGLGARCRF